jgi:hypothetical protein
VWRQNLRAKYQYLSSENNQTHRLGIDAPLATNMFGQVLDPPVKIDRAVLKKMPVNTIESFRLTAEDGHGCSTSPKIRIPKR